MCFHAIPRLVLTIIREETNWHYFMHMQLLALLADSLVEAQEQRGATALDNVSGTVELDVWLLLDILMSILL